MRNTDASDQVQLKVRGWAAIVTGLVVVLALGFVVALVMLGLFLVAIPVMIVAPLIYYFGWRPRIYSMVIKGNDIKQHETIDGTYRVAELDGSAENVSSNTDEARL